MARKRDEKITNEEKLRRKREKERDRRRQIKEDPVKREEQREKECQKYLRQREKKIKKSIDELTPREQRQKRKQWNINSRNYRLKKKTAATENNYQRSELTPPPSDEENHPPRAQLLEPRKSSGRKRANKQRVKRHREKKDMVSKIDSLRKKLEKYKKRYHRLKNTKNFNNKSRSTVGILSPNTKANILWDGRIHESRKEEVRKEILFGEVVKEQLNESYQGLKSNKEKQVFKKIISGRIVRKYGFQTHCSKLFKYRVLTGVTAENLLQYKRTTSIRNKLANKLKGQVQKFLEQDNNSRICPGKKDCVTKNKIKRQKRFLTNTMKNLHKNYLKQYPAPKVSYRFFCRNRPFWVKQMKVQDRETCKCITHANMDLVTHCLHINGVISAKKHLKASRIKHAIIATNYVYLEHALTAEHVL